MLRRTVLHTGLGSLVLGAPFVLRAQAPINLRMQGFLAAGALSTNGAPSASAPRPA